jgi:hypothetical protein
VIPDDVRRAARLKFAKQPHHAELDEEISVGRVVKVQSYPDRDGRQIARLAVVVAVNDEDQTIRILLAASAKEFATDLDLVVTPKVSELPYDLLVQGELYGTIFEEQVVATIATLDPALAAAADAALASDGESLEAYETGWPLGAIGDPRRAFKEHELDELEALVRECRRVADGLAADEQFLDVGLLVPPPVGTDPDIAGERFVEVLDVVEKLGPGKIKLPPEWLDDDTLLAEFHRWQSEFGLPITRILDRYALAAGDLDDSAVDEPSVSTATDPRERADHVVRRVLHQRGASGPAVVDIYTTRSEWHRRHAKDFIRECVRPDAVVRAFARTLEETAV